MDASTPGGTRRTGPRFQAFSGRESPSLLCARGFSYALPRSAPASRWLTTASRCRSALSSSDRMKAGVVRAYLARSELKRT